MLTTTDFLVFLSLICFSIGLCAGQNAIVPDSHKLLTEEISARDISHIFDNDHETQCLIHSDVNQHVALLVSLPYDSRIDRVEITSEIPAELKQTLRVGYADSNGSLTAGLFYDCVINKTSTVCQPPCMNHSDGSGGVSGLALLWTLDRVKDKGWTRIYDVVIQGKRLDELSENSGRVGDIGLLKPYHDLSQAAGDGGNSCEKPIWRLTDTSPADSQMEPISNVHHNIELYFGRKSSVNRIGLIASTKGEKISETVMSFEGPKPLVKTLDLNKDCAMEDPAHGLLLCEVPELSGYPFVSVKVDLKGLIRLQVHGKPFFYPQLGIIPSAKTADPGASEDLHLKCVAVSCGSPLVKSVEGMIRGKSSQQCHLTGKLVECANLQLLRVHMSRKNDSSSALLSDSVLVSHGQIEPEVAVVMTEMRLINSSNSQMTVSLPRTHPYYGQYKCRCQADDQVGSVIESAKTALTESEFDQDLVFQRNYTAIFLDQPIENRLGFFELPDDPQAGYFRLIVAGHSLTEKLDLNATFLESGVFASVTGDYAQVSSVPAFPRAKGTDFAWPIAAYRVELQEAWPDCVDDQPIHIEWKTSDEDFSVKSVKDEIRTIVLSASRDGSLRAWLWGRSEQLLDMRAYYQVGNHPVTSTELYLKRSGCGSGNSADRLGSIKLTEEGCMADTTQPLTPTCVRTQHGFVVQFAHLHPSASDTYTLYRVSSDGQPDQMLVQSAAMIQNLESELNDVDVQLKIESISTSGDPEASEMNVAVVVYSKVLVDSSACRPIHLKLHPTWPLSDTLESPLTANEVRFRMPVPNDQTVITLEMELRIEATGDSQPEVVTKRSLTIPNPRHYVTELTVDQATGYVEWAAMPPPFRGLLDRYQLKIFRENQVCGLREELDTPVIREEFNGSPFYRVHLSDITEFNSQLLVNYDIEVTPLLKSHSSAQSIAGTKATTKLSRGKVDSTLIKIDSVAASRTAKFYVVPSQRDKCLQAKDAMWATFNLHVIGEDSVRPTYLADVQFEPEPLDVTADFGRWYTAHNLLPGRRYEINATVTYMTGLLDKPSAFAQFWTTDEVSVYPSLVTAVPGDRVIFNCTGTVGPNGQYRKRLEWRRQDGTPLPDGSHSEPVKLPESPPEWSETVSLVFNSVESGQSNSYACFIRPSVLELIGKPYSAPSVRLSVSEIQLSTQSLLAETGDSIAVDCRSDQPYPLTWITSNGKPVPAGSGDSNKPYVTTESESDHVNTLILHIPKVTLALTGDYVCKQTDSVNSRKFQLRMKEDIQLIVGRGIQSKAGDPFTLNCTAHLGHSNQTIRWYKRNSVSEPWIPITPTSHQFSGISISDETSHHHIQDNNRISRLKWIYFPGSSGQFACDLELSSEEKETADSTVVQTKLKLSHRSATIPISFDPVIKIERSVAEGNRKVSLNCIGYPAHEEDRLGWFYAPQNDSVKPIPLDDSTEDLGDDELRSQLRETFKSGEYIPASWPGSASPVLLAASARLRSIRSVNKSDFTAESLVLHVTANSDAEIPKSLASGSLLCRYKRPSAMFMWNEGIMVHPPERETGKQRQIQRSIPISDIFEDQPPTTPAEAPEIALAGAAQHGGDNAAGNLQAKLTWSLLTCTSYIGARWV